MIKVDSHKEKAELENLLTEGKKRGHKKNIMLRDSFEKKHSPVLYQKGGIVRSPIGGRGRISPPPYRQNFSRLRTSAGRRKKSMFVYWRGRGNHKIFGGRLGKSGG